MVMLIQYCFGWLVGHITVHQRASRDDEETMMMMILMILMMMMLMMMLTMTLDRQRTGGLRTCQMNLFHKQGMQQKVKQPLTTCLHSDQLLAYLHV